MTTVYDLKPGDRIRYTPPSREGVLRSEPNKYRNEIELTFGDGRKGFIYPSETGTWELLDRPLPEEPPEGSIVIFHHESGPEAWKRWGAHLGWLHAGNSTPTGRERRTGRQGLTWQELLEGPSRHVERTVITP